MARRTAATRPVRGAALPLAALTGAARAQAFPNKTVRIVVPALAGSADAFARAIAQRLGPALGQTVLVEQKPGAGTNLGNDFVAKSAPDGHTMLINGLPLVTNQALYASLPYDTMRDLTPVIEVAEVASVTVAAEAALAQEEVVEAIAVVEAAEAAVVEPEAELVQELK